MKNVVIVGAGFSGLSLAYYLTKCGFSVSIIDKNKGPGGMIQSIRGKHGTTETAANGFLNTPLVENFLLDIGASFVGSSEESKKRFIFRNGLRRWPLNLIESLHFAFKVLKFFFKSKVEKLARAEDTVKAWSDRHFTPALSNYLLAPALQGIYAGDVNQLSGELIINPILNRKKEKKLSSSSLLSATGGMGALMKDLEKHLIRQGVQFVYGKSWSPEISADLLVIATSAVDAVSLLKKLEVTNARENALQLSQIQSEGLISITQFFEKKPSVGRGFGVLFPRKESIRPLGILMNNVIFNRSEEKHSETWILGGALDKSIMGFEDDEIKNIVRNSREAVFSDHEVPLESVVTRWPSALPHYTVDHEKIIHSLKPMAQVILHGNYLGVIGLSRILEKSKLIAETLAKGNT